jgi:hypothetical protein
VALVDGSENENVLGVGEGGKLRAVLIDSGSDNTAASLAVNGPKIGMGSDGVHRLIDRKMARDEAEISVIERIVNLQKETKG